MDIILTEIVSDHFSIDKEVCWLKCRTSSGSLIAFWGELGRPTRNITSIRNQVLPLHIEILNPESCTPTDHERKEHSISLSIPANVQLVMHQE